MKCEVDEEIQQLLLSTISIFFCHIKIKLISEVKLTILFSCWILILSLSMFFLIKELLPLVDNYFVTLYKNIMFVLGLQSVISFDQCTSDFNHYYICKRNAPFILGDFVSGLFKDISTFFYANKTRTPFMSLSNLWLVHIKFLESMTIYTIIFFLISLVNSELLPFLQKWILFYICTIHKGHIMCLGQYKVTWRIVIVPN